jgi:CHAT domain-containing protein
MSGSEIAKKVPPGVALVEFWIADQQLHSWVVRSNSIVPFSTRINPGALGRQIEHLHREITEDKGSDWKGVSQALFNTLIAPLEPALRGARVVVLVPDGVLYNLPFAALLDPTSHYFIEQYSLVVSPSASLYIRAFLQEKNRGSTPLRSVLSLGDPTIDREVLQELPRLPQANKEAAQVADLYPQADVRVGVAATKQAFLEGLAIYDVVHFAGHAVWNPTTPSSSFLALAPSEFEGDSGVLYSRDLYDVTAPYARLVVLSACSALRSNSVMGDGPSGIARPLLYAGVPAVLGNLWNTNDRSASLFFVEFHRHLRDGLGAASALRAAQLTLISSPDPELSAPVSWAGFQLIGAGSSGNY